MTRLNKAQNMEQLKLNKTLLPFRQYASKEPARYSLFQLQNKYTMKEFEPRPKQNTEMSNIPSNNQHVLLKE
jgi:hypothetical protein